MNSAVLATLVPMNRWLVNRSHARLWYGQAVSLIGDAVFDTTLALWVGTILLRGKSWAPAAVAGVMVAVALATLVVGPLAGVFVDRWDYRRTMLGADLVRAGLIGLLAVVASLPAGVLDTKRTLVVLYGVVLLATAAAQFFNPARFALIGDVVPEAQRARAAGLGQATLAIAAIVGPPLAAPLLFAVGVRWALLANALSFLVSFVLVRSVRVRAPAAAVRPAVHDGRPGLWRELVAGLRFFGRSRILVALAVTILLVQAGAGSLNALLVFFVPDNLHARPSWFGALGMVFGTGSVIGALGAGAAATRLGSARTFCLGLFLGGVGIIVFARQSALWPALLVFGLAAVPIGALNTVFTPLVFRATPREYLGRVWAVFAPAIQLATMVSVLLAGWLASTVLRDLHATPGGLRLGRIDVIFLAAGLLVVIGSGYATLALRAADRARPPPREPVVLENETG